MQKNKEVIIISVFDGNTSIINQMRPLGSYVSIQQSVTITSGVGILQEIPNRAAGITLLNGSTPVATNDATIGQLPTDSIISVDWDQGLIFTTPAYEGLSITANFIGMGAIFLSSQRIFTQHSGNTITQLLSDVVGAASQFTFIGSYSNSTTYLKYNVVFYQGASYACTVTSSLGNLPTSTSFFTKIAGTIFRNTYNSGTTYASSDYVVNATGDALYVSIVDGNIGQSLTDTTKWLPTISFLSVTASEASRVSAESVRVGNETTRQSSETTRISQESTRQSQEATRVSQENTRQTDTTNAITNLNNTASALVNRGIYSGSTNYNINNVVFYNGVSYMCIVAGTGNTPSSVSTFWNRMTGFVSQGLWNSGITYSVTHVVYDSVNQNLYMSLIDNNLNNALSDTSKWQLLITISPLILNTKHFGAYSAVTSYVQNNVVSYNGSSYMNILACSNVLPTVTSNWQLIGSQGIQGIQGLKGNQWRGAYSGATSYVVDDVTSYNGSSYICILASLNNIPTNTTYWSLLAAAGANGAGTVASILSTDASIAVGGTAQNPDLSVQTGVTANKIPKRDANGIILNSGNQITAKSASTTLLLSESGIINVTTSTSTITIILPSAATAQVSYLIKKVDSGTGTITIATTSSQTIDGLLTRTLTTQYSYIQLVSDGSNWVITDISNPAPYDNSITIIHNLNLYPDVLPIKTYSAYGNGGGFGSAPFGGGSLFKLINTVEYIDTYSLKVYLSDGFSGTPTITQNSTNEFMVNFSTDQNSLTLLLK